MTIVSSTRLILSATKYATLKETGGGGPDIADTPGGNGPHTGVITRPDTGDGTMGASDGTTVGRILASTYPGFRTRLLILLGPTRSSNGITAPIATMSPPIGSGIH